MVGPQETYATVWGYFRWILLFFIAALVGAWLYNDETDYLVILCWAVPVLFILFFGGTWLHRAINKRELKKDKEPDGTV